MTSLMKESIPSLAKPKTASFLSAANSSCRCDVPGLQLDPNTLWSLSLSQVNYVDKQMNTFHIITIIVAEFRGNQVRAQTSIAFESYKVTQIESSNAPFSQLEMFCRCGSGLINLKLL